MSFVLKDPDRKVGSIWLYLQGDDGELVDLNAIARAIHVLFHGHAKGVDEGGELEFSTDDLEKLLRMLMPDEPFTFHRSEIALQLMEVGSRWGPLSKVVVPYTPIQIPFSRGQRRILLSVEEPEGEPYILFDFGAEGSSHAAAGTIGILGSEWESVWLKWAEAETVELLSPTDLVEEQEVPAG